nr:MAG TPA: hypothetical protein [Caudoviricetes sp.]
MHIWNMLITKCSKTNHLTQCYYLTQSLNTIPYLTHSSHHIAIDLFYVESPVISVHPTGVLR